MPLWFVVVFIGVCLVFPKTMAHLFIAPFLGTIVGSFCWCVAASWTEAVQSLEVFFGFVFAGIALLQYVIYLEGKGNGAYG